MTCDLHPSRANDRHTPGKHPDTFDQPLTSDQRAPRQVLCAAMRRGLVVCVLWMVLGTPAAVRADGGAIGLDTVFVVLAASLLPSSLGAGIENERSLHVPVIVSWATQIPLSGDGGRVSDEFGTWRLMIDPMLAIDDRGVDFELRIAPRLTVTESRDLALFISAGSTAKLGPFKPSTHVEIGLITATNDLEIRYWIALRADTWFGEVSAQRVSLATGWAIW